MSGGVSVCITTCALKEFPNQLNKQTQCLAACPTGTKTVQNKCIAPTITSSQGALMIAAGVLIVALVVSGVTFAVMKQKKTALAVVPTGMNYV